MIETDLKKIEHAAELRELENMKFRSFLKGYCDLESEEIDALVQRLTQEVAWEMNCDSCRNCCSLPPEVDAAELPSLAATLGMSVKDFKRLLIKEPLHATMGLVNPCPFLREKDGQRTCAAGDAKPRLCVEYPYLMKPEFTTRLLGVVENYGECPIVYNVYERLKKALAAEFAAAMPSIDRDWDMCEEE